MILHLVVLESITCKGQTSQTDGWTDNMTTISSHFIARGRMKKDSTDSVKHGFRFQVGNTEPMGKCLEAAFCHSCDHKRTYSPVGVCGEKDYLA